MCAYYRNNGYEEEPDYPGYSGPRNHMQGYLNTQDYPGSLNNSAYSKTRENPYSGDSRTSLHYPQSLAEPDYPGSLSNPDYSAIRNDPYSASSGRQPGYPRSLAEPDYPGSQNNSDYPGTRSNPYSAGSRSSDYPTSLAKPDASWSNPYHPYSFKEPDYSESPRNPDFAGSRGSGNYAGSRTNPDDLGFLGEPDYPGAQGNATHPGPRANSNYPGFRRNQGYAGSRIKPSIDTLGEPDYPGAENQSYSPNFLEKPDYPGAEDYQNSLHFGGEPDYPNAEDDRDYGSSKTPEMTRGVLSRTSSVHHGRVSPLGLLARQHEEYPENIEMESMEMANPYGYSDNGYVNPAYVDESSPGPTYGNSPPGGDWYKSSQGQKLIASLIPMTSRERIKAIRNQPRTMEEKRKLRRMVDKEKSKQSRRIFELNCCTQCLNSISLAYRRCKNILSELLNSISLWQKTLKIIGGKFGTSILSYFNFLRWLLKFNIFSFIVTFSFITIPQFTVGGNNALQFTGLEFFTGAGYFTDTVMYYGFYTNSTIRHRSGGASYNMQLAYIFTVAACLIICFFSLLFSMARYFRNNFINPHIYSRGIAKLIFCWDFTITHEKAVKLKQKNLSTEIRENLSEILQENVKLTLNQQLTRLSVHLAAWVVSTGVAIACCVAVYYLAENNLEFLKSHQNPGAVLLLPFVVSCINLAVPRFYSMFGLVEHFEVPRQEVYVLLIRNIFLKISIIGILCYYWLHNVALAGEECWETLIGQEIYRLLLMDFVFSLADSFLGEFLRRIIGMQFITSLGLQEFDIARNVLELIYAQTLVWIGTFFCPLLPFIQMITLFIMFYVKNISLMMNFQPPSKAWRASQMMTFFIFLLFFPSFTGVLCTLAITIWRLKPSADCGPFRGLPFFIHSIYSWIDTLSKSPSYLWVVWIYQNLIGSVHFFFILTLIVLIITYLYWQITEGRKIMIRLLHEQIINEGKDKMFLIEKLTKLQDTERRANPSSFTLERTDVEEPGPLHSREHEAARDLRFRRSVQENIPKA
ncbi:transmembrane channel-like protein 5 [Myotis daubentonii]|uniref:transmembrane channel-like protein 5 n=1 Tax=Myotis daubentonii TaxID=98922 RepID=UPI002873EC5B|nr:transmembrane channel-like protein 5 [Myotis daubentonii]XP_059549293.1 transmembrane channel-like protein 5 [Myotis daubentonii]XP_059549294.1 transmembrane channel-like protein 5 [Myotis daubentonii]XP_059549295.1 transmembrane channel-like protein 5 [Myotis daubentonii]XP_059549296.1 transmembrane channel-like protein 5 [Myotis daubentonii]XP_059549297.1 transmembrane channel-like protein 5 [Myotis daubentonii]XP_059549298.1 transmembrane channel-like protein 5 [Myotis daubentonii]XP_0